MSRHLLSTIVLALLSTTASAQSSNAETPLLVIDQQRQYAYGTFPRHADWQGLYCNGLACELKPTQVGVSTAAAMDITDQVAPLDVLSAHDQPLAMFPAASFHTGEVTTWYRAKDATVDSNQTRSLEKLGKWQLPWGASPLTISWVQTAEGHRRYHVSDGTTKQFLFRVEAEGHFGGGTTPIVHWAGDIDGDGKVDMLLSIPDDNCGFDERLYLSSDAGEGKLLRKAAQLTGAQAACGC
jgi:hypothetical protein